MSKHNDHIDDESDDKSDIEIDSTELINNLEFCVIDLETTGGNLQKDKIIEIGLVKIQNCKIVQEMSYLINPEIPIPDFIQKLTSIRNDQIVKAPKIEEIIDPVLDFIGESILVAHNVSFDVPFFNAILKRLGKEKLKNNSLCTNLMTRFLIPNILNSNLGYMCRIFGIRHQKAHRALEDAKAAAYLLLTYLEIFKKKQIKKINHLYYPKNRYELDRYYLKNIASESKAVTEQQIFRELVNFQTPMSITLKGEKGVFLASMPILNAKSEIDFIRDMFITTPYKTMTIKMYGSFFEAITHFNNNFFKLSPTVQKKTLDHLCEEHKIEVNEKAIQNYEATDFLIVPHLIPEQFVIYPLGSLNSVSHNAELIFRLPGQKKKFVHFIFNNLKRIEQISKKSKKNMLHPEVTIFLNAFLTAKKSYPSSNYMFLKKEDFAVNEDQLVKNIQEKLNLVKSPFNYPKEHF